MAEQSISGTMVDYNGGLTATGYLARPTAAGTYPGVIVLQEWWGLDDHIKDVARRFAQEGFVALAPDLYHGQVAAEPDEARKLAMEMDRENAVREITQGASYLLNSGSVAGAKVGVVGFCMGGGLSLLTACRSDKIGASVIFYGGNPNPIDQTQNITCPILGIYGEDDQGLWPNAVNQLREALTRYGKQFEVHSYAGAPHAFFNDTQPNIYRPAASRDAWAKTLTFYRQHLPQAS